MRGLQASLGTLTLLASAVLSSGCDGSTSTATVTQVATPAAPSEPQPRLTASIQEIMQGMVDPSADAVWESVGTTITAAGTEERQPHTDAQWQQVRLQAVTLIESTNLLMMPGRRMVAPGAHIADEGWEGVLTTQQAQSKLVAQRAAFVQFAGALHEVAGRMLQAIEARQVEQMLEVGTQMDEVCESCHVAFWYPQQLLPSVPTSLGNQESTAH